jgi:hypothetical protein
MVWYFRETSEYLGSNSNSTTTRVTTTTSDLTPITGNFLAGHIYRLQPSVYGNSVSFAFNEDANTSIWYTEDLASVKPPKKVPASVTASNIVNSAASEPATQFEGTWIVTEVPPEGGATAMEITFTGKSYLIKITFAFNAAQLEERNRNRKIVGQRTLVSPIAYTGQRGTFEINGNALTLGVLQVAMDNDLDSVVWTSFNQSDIQFDYSLGSDGSLMLNFKKGQQVFNYLGQNPILTKRE